MPVEKFIVTGKCKSRIKSRALACLKINQIKAGIEDTSIICEASGKLEMLNMQKWENVFIELHTLQPDIDVILSLFLEYKDQTIEHVKYFKDKIQKMKNRSAIESDVFFIGKTKIIVEFHHTLETAQDMLNDYLSHLKFINECIVEIKESVLKETENKGTSIKQQQEPV